MGAMHALDHSTRLYASTVERTDVLGLTPELDLPKTGGNETVLCSAGSRVLDWVDLRGRIRPREP